MTVKSVAEAESILESQLDKCAIDKILADIYSLLTAEAVSISNGLYQGKAGIVLFLTYYHLYTKDEAHLQAAIELLEQVVADSSEQQQESHLARGFTGLCWLLKHLTNLHCLDEVDDMLRDMQPVIIDSLQLDLQEANFDLLYGAIGKAVYLREYNAQQFQPETAQLCQRLWQAATVAPGGIYWPDLYAEAPAGAVNMGLAHGGPGFIVFILNALPVIDSAAEKQLRAGIGWILQQENSTGASRFPTQAVVGQPPTEAGSSRLAWCYGDLGISYMLLLAGSRLRDRDLVAKGIEIGKATAERDETSGFVRFDEARGCHDVGFCHGTAGITYLYQELYRLSNCEIFANCAGKWCEKTIQDVNTKMCYIVDDVRWQNDVVALEREFGVIEGLAGVGLVLLSVINPDDQDWKKLFLLGEF
jgi:lantibiotic biosynthesis protein